MRENRTYGSGGKEAGNSLLTLIVLSAPTLVGGQRGTAGDGLHALALPGRVALDANNGTPARVQQCSGPALSEQYGRALRIARAL
jgi:hypothetical protein